jgi:hypothetical protein
MKARLAPILAIAAMVASGCTKQTERVFIEGELALLEAPYPLDWPRGAPKPNRLIRRLHDENVEVLDTFADKDFLVSKIRTSDGVEGYVVCCSRGMPFEQFPARK